jgi:hypothetical protein
VRLIEFGEAKGGLAELTVLLLRMRQPFHQTFLMDVFDATTAFAGIKQGLSIRGLTSTDSTGISLCPRRAAVAAGNAAEGNVGGCRGVESKLWRIHSC